MRTVAGGLMVLLLASLEDAEKKAPAGPSPEDLVAAERKANDEAFGSHYLLIKELFHEHAGKWIVIVGGELLPLDDKMQVTPAGTLEECVAAAEKKRPGASHRYLFRIGEEGEITYGIGAPKGPNVVGMGLHRLMRTSMNYDGVALTTTWLREGKAKTFPMTDVAVMEITLSDPRGKSARKVVMTDSAGFSGVALLEPALAGSLGLSRFEIPGTARIDGSFEKLSCRRARVRLQVPEIDVDLVVPVAVWLRQQR